MNSNYCPLIFHGIYIERSVDYKHTIAPCCLAQQSPAQTGQVDVANDPYLNGIRTVNTQNLRPPECAVCWTLEDQGGESKRQMTLDLYKNAGIALDHTAVLYSMDYNTRPLCNARCIICGPRYSSTWAASLGLTDITAIIKEDADPIIGIDFDQLKTIYFNGGEPLLTDEHLQVLRRFNNIGAVDIFYNTNGSCWPSTEVLDLWSQARSVTVAFSIDGTGDEFERIRTPLKWHEVSANIQRANLLDNVTIQCAYTIGTHNVSALKPTIEWFEKLPNFDLYQQFHVHYVYPGHKFYFDRATVEQRLQFQEELSCFKEFHWYDSIINSLTI